MVKNNEVNGAGTAFAISAFASETPGVWGWSHVPAFGVTFAGNRIANSPRSAHLNVFHNEYNKLNKGRVYMTVTVQNNEVIWSDAFLKSRPRDPKTPLAGITFGEPGSIDPGELIVTERDDHVSATNPPGASARVAGDLRDAQWQALNSQDVPASRQESVARFARHDSKRYHRSCRMRRPFRSTVSRGQESDVAQR